MPKLKPGTIWPTDEEEAEIQRQIAEDPEDSAHWEYSGPPRPAVEVDPELVEYFLRTPGKQKAPTKVAISIRLDADIVRHLKASGAGWQTRLYHHQNAVHMIGHDYASIQALRDIPLAHRQPLAH